MPVHPGAPLLASIPKDNPNVLHAFIVQELLFQPVMYHIFAFKLTLSSLLHFEGLIVQPIDLPPYLTRSEGKSRAPCDSWPGPQRPGSKQIGPNRADRLTRSLLACLHSHHAKKDMSFRYKHQVVQNKIPLSQCCKNSICDLWRVTVIIFKSLPHQ